MTIESRVRYSRNVETMPAGVWHTPKHEYFWNGDGPYPSVTTVLGIIDKPALVGWAKRETAECAIRNLEILEVMRRNGGDRAAVEWLKGIPDYQRDQAAARGTRVHAAAEAYGRGVELDVEPEDMPFVDAYRRFLVDYNVVPIVAEVGVIGRTPYGPYGGTLDLIAELDWPEPDGPHVRRRALLDLKTSKGTYKETALQLAGYGGAQWCGFAGDPTPYEIPAVDVYGVVHIRPDVHQERGYAVVPYEVGPDTYSAFEAAYRLSQWLSGPNPKGRSA